MSGPSVASNGAGERSCEPSLKIADPVELKKRSHENVVGQLFGFCDRDPVGDRDVNERSVMLAIERFEVYLRSMHEESRATLAWAAEIRKCGTKECLTVPI